MRVLTSRVWRERAVGLPFWCWVVLSLSALPLSVSAQAQLFVDRDTIDFGTTQTGIVRADSFVVANVGSNVDSLRVDEILLIGDSGFSLSFPSTPFRLPKNQFVRVYVEYRPVNNGLHTAWAKVQTEVGIDSVLLIAGTSGPIRVQELDSIYRLRFSPTEVGKSANSSITLTAEGGDVTITELSSQDPDASYFALQTPIAGGIKLRNQEQTSLSFNYQPLSTGTHVALYQCQTDKGIFLIELQGEAFASPQDTTLLKAQLDTASGNVGEVVTMRLKTDFPLEHASAITTFELNLKYNPRSLWFQGVRSSIPNVSLVVEQVSESEQRVVVTSVEGITTNGEELLLIDWVGLSTGLPKNEVRGDVTLIVKGVATAEETLGLVLLEGCTIGSESFGRRVLISSIGIDPTGNELLVGFIPPDGVAGRLDVVDILGESRGRVELDRGSGTEEKVRVNVADLPRGLYAARFEFADDVLLVPFVRP
ncbi:MAG: choice-of-anchor D domain-containing protein [Ignavibacteriae bacterium]|nr:choice-of-anchor D domain-containing protein [Ignavibacteriota bacterium]MCB9217467.1 choice-of-anchor D domain-containing protein [Ignavibacteria bacterium]